MNRYQNYSLDGKYFILTEVTPANIWQTTIFLVDKKTGYINFDSYIEQLLHSSEASAKAHHEKSMYYWSGNVSPEDVIGIGEGFY